MKKVLKILCTFLVVITIITFSLKLFSFNDNTNDTELREENKNSNYQSNIDYIHISFDDVSTSFNNLSNNNYSSLFDEQFFKELKSLHKEYGAKFSLYTYNSVLNNVPSAYLNDFKK